MMRPLAVAIVATVFALSLSACGERPQVVNYKQGSYQGKPDTPPYANAPYSDSKDGKDEWERAIRARQQSQNEYKRTGG
jgi:hypothetical protein